MSVNLDNLIRENHLPPQVAGQVRAAVALIEQPPCNGGDNSSCTTSREYHSAWKTLTRASPTVGLKLLSMKEYRWPNPEEYVRTTRRLPDDAQKEPAITEELWNRAMAFRWVLRNIDPSRRLDFLERSISLEDTTHGLVWVKIAKTNMSAISEPEQSFLRQAEELFLSSDPDNSKRNLAGKVLKNLYAVELVETVSTPIE